MGWCRHQLVIQADEKLTAQERRMADATRTLAGQLAAGQKVPLHLTIHNPNSSEVETMDFSGNSAPEVSPLPEGYMQPDLLTKRCSTCQGTRPSSRQSFNHEFGHGLACARHDLPFTMYEPSSCNSCAMVAVPPR